MTTPFDTNPDNPEQPTHPMTPGLGEPTTPLPTQGFPGPSPSDPQDGANPTMPMPTPAQPQYGMLAGDAPTTAMPVVNATGGEAPISAMPQYGEAPTTAMPQYGEAPTATMPPQGAMPAGQPTHAGGPAGPGQLQPGQPQPGGVDRFYALSPQQLFSAIHDQLTTGATFTLDHEDPQAGRFACHAFDGAALTIALSPQGAAGTAVHVEATDDPNGKRTAEFLAALDQRIGAVPLAGAQNGQGAAYIAVPQAARKTSKLAVFAIIWNALFVLSSFVMGPTAWAGLIGAVLIPALLSGFAVYVTRADGKVQGRVLAWVAVGLAVLGLIVGGVSVVRSGIEDKKHDASLATTCESYTWPSSEIAQLLPEPESGKGEITSEGSDYFSIDICDIDASAYAAYVQSVQDKGFTVDYSKSNDYFNAKNEAGYSVSIHRGFDDETVMSITISAPDEDADEPADSTDDGADAGDTSDQGSADGGSGTTDNGQSSPAPSTTPSGDFKTTMDNYEAFIDEYVAFMTTYQNSDDTIGMLADYADMVQRYTELSAEIAALDDGTLGADDLAYYTEVTTRCVQKLASVGQ